MSYYSPAVPSLRVDFGVVLLVLLVLVVVTGVKQSQLLVLGLRLEFDNIDQAMSCFLLPFVIQV